MRKQRYTDYSTLKVNAIYVQTLSSDLLLLTLLTSSDKDYYFLYCWEING
jgi:hypothetical protein